MSLVPQNSDNLFKRLFCWAYSWGKLIFRGAYYWKEFCVSKWIGLDNKNSLKQLKTASTNSPWAYIQEGLLLEGFLRLRFRGLIFGRAYFWRRLLSEF